MALATEGGTTYLYVSDHLGGRIIKFDTSTGEVAAILGSPGTGNGQFGEPYGLAIEPVSGDLYVAERGNDRVQRITSSGEFVMAWGGPGTEPGLFNEPIGLAVDASGTVYVTEHSNHRVQQFSVTQSGGTWSTTAIGMWGSQGSGPGQFNIPYGIAIEPAGSILVADGFNGRVQRFSADGSYQATIGAAGTAPGQFVVATGVTTDAAGAIYVTSTNPDPQNGASADAASQWVSKFTAAGGFESRFGGVHGTGPGEFRLPFFIVLGAGNRAYISDYYNNRVQVFDLGTVPGGGGSGGGGSTDTTAPAVASFSVGAATLTNVIFQITFSESVTGVDAADFEVQAAGGAAATIGAVGGSEAIYTIPVELSGTGTIQLNLKPAGTGIVDLSGNAIVAGAIGPIHTIGSSGGDDGSAGSLVSGILVPGNGAYEAGQELAFVVNFDAPVNVTVPRREAKGKDRKEKSGKDRRKDDDDTEGDDDRDREDDDDRDDNGGRDRDDDRHQDRGDDGDEDRDDDGRAAPYFTWQSVGATDGRGTSGKVVYVSGSGTTALKFVYRVRKEDRAPAGIQLGTTIELPAGAEIRAAGGQLLEAAARTLPWPQNPLPGVTMLGSAQDGHPAKGTGPVIVLKPGKGAIVGQPIALPSTTESGTAIRWVLVSGNATLDGNILTARNKGAIVLRAVADGAGPDPAAPAAEVTVAAYEMRKDRLVNLSSRLRVSGGDANRAAIAGFVVTGAGEKSVLIRAIGPGLRSFGLRDALARLRLEVRDDAGKLVASSGAGRAGESAVDAARRVGAFELAPGGGDAALLLSLAPGAYTAQVVAEGSGITLVEVYDAGQSGQPAAEQLGNISTRGFVDTEDGQLVAGFVVGGEAPKQVLIRGIGPALAQFGVANALADPRLSLHATGSGAVLAGNDDWETSLADTDASAASIRLANQATGAFPLPPGSKDAAILVTLPPGSYSAVMSGAGGTTGVGLVEVYEVPND